MKPCKHNERREMDRRSFHFCMRRLIVHYRGDWDCSQDIVEAIKAYERLYGQVKDE